ncbi:ABC transporter ATP-binding protein [Vagococcus fluvialis]|uniref:ABC transporter ATP-binding protein n=1 Tax=Vagococcus fluvialis TaxID=2738 RepID=UPI003B591D9B
MKKILEVNNLKKVFKKANGESHTAVNGISFDLYEGEVFSFLGPNGAGKSTTINMVTTQLSLTSGTIKIDSEDIKKNPINARTKIGIVAQHNNLDRGLTAHENLLYHGRYFGLSKEESEKRAESLLKDFGLYDWKDDYVKSFSGGMAQRLKIARAIMHKPAILFLDEPTTGLDPAYREILWEHVLRLNKENKTTVFLTTHYMEEPERFSDRVAIYNKGEIKAIGTIDELRKQIPSESLIYLKVGQVSDIFTKQIEKLATVKSVKVVDEKNYVIYPKSSKEALTDVLHLFDHSVIQLENIQLSSTTLDDIFIHLTTNEGDK